MPDTLVNLISPAEPTSKARCAKSGTSKKAVKAETASRPTATMAALAAAGTARSLHSAIFREADGIEIGTRRAKTSLDLVLPVVDDVSALSDKGEALADRLFLLLGIVSDELKNAHARADKIFDAVRDLKHPTPAQTIGGDDDLVTLRLQLKTAEDALNAVDNDEPPLVDAYDEANDRFLDAPARTPAGLLLKLERLADLGEMEKDPEISTNRIVLNLIRDLRGALGVNGQVQ